MLYYFFNENTIKYIYFPLFISFFFSFIISNYFIFILNKYKFYQNNRIFIPRRHLLKKNIPTMGGIIILIPFLLLSIIFIDFNNKSILFLFLFFIFNFIIGFIDDYIKCFVFNSNGLSIINKYLLQSFLIIIYIIYLFNIKNNFLYNYFFFIFNFFINIKYFYLLLWYFLLIGCINSVNFTDGLDGLVVFPLILNFLFLLIVSFFYFKYYLFTNLYISNIIFYKNLILINSIMIGSLLSFLIFNFHPAKIFLGDTGSLSIGSLLGSIYILLNKEWYLLLVGFIFLIESITVILQILWFKFFRKRLFYMTPIHHHYEICGYSENKIVLFFWFISLFFFILSLLIFLINYVYL